MGQFTNGVILGVGLALLFTPKTGSEMRSLLAERVQALRGIPPENEELKQQVQQMAERVQEAQQTASRAADMGNAVQSDLSNVARLAGTDTPPPSAPNRGQSTQTGQAGTPPSSAPNRGQSTRPGQSRRDRR